LIKGDIRQQTHYFSSSPPAGSTVEVAKLPRNAEIEMEAIAFGLDKSK
jgi:enamine deaminase RidA (YjgF/YER057c/UK114 family)